MRIGARFVAKWFNVGEGALERQGAVVSAGYVWLVLPVDAHDIV